MSSLRLLSLFRSFFSNFTGIYSVLLGWAILFSRESYQAFTGTWRAASQLPQIRAWWAAFIVLPAGCCTWCLIAIHTDFCASLGHWLGFIVTLCLLACIPFLWLSQLPNFHVGPTDSKTPLLVAGETLEEDSGRQLEGLCRALSVQGWWQNGMRTRSHISSMQASGEL